MGSAYLTRTNQMWKRGYASDGWFCTFIYTEIYQRSYLISPSMPELQREKCLLLRQLENWALCVWRPLNNNLPFEIVYLHYEGRFNDRSRHITTMLSCIHMILWYIWPWRDIWHLQWIWFVTSAWYNRSYHRCFVFVGSNGKSRSYVHTWSMVLLTYTIELQHYFYKNKKPNSVCCDYMPSQFGIVFWSTFGP